MRSVYALLFEDENLTQLEKAASNAERILLARNGNMTLTEACMFTLWELCYSKKLMQYNK